MGKELIVDKVKDELKRKYILACNTVDAKTGAIIWMDNNCDDVYVVELNDKSGYSDYYMPMKNVGTGSAIGAAVKSKSEMLTAVADVVHQVMQESGYVREKRKVIVKDIDINCVIVCIGIIALFQFAKYLISKGLSGVMADPFYSGQAVLGLSMILIGTNVIKVSSLNRCRLVFTIGILAIGLSMAAVLYMLFVLEVLHITVKVWFAVTLLVCTFGFIMLIWGYRKSVMKLR